MRQSAIEKNVVNKSNSQDKIEAHLVALAAIHHAEPNCLSVSSIVNISVGNVPDKLSEQLDPEVVQGALKKHKAKFGDCEKHVEAFQKMAEGIRLN